MARFAAGETDVLVATTVIEVGVDVPNATVMVICDADRFGISQLHQLRGRIGRGGHTGVCLLLTNAEPGTPARDRLAAVAGTRDGFALAEVDLEQRREGDVLGSSQSGRRSSLRLLRVLDDADLIAHARDLAARCVTDPDLDGRPGLADIVTDVERRAAGGVAGHGHVSRIVAGSRGGRRLETPTGDADPADDRPGARGPVLRARLLGGHGRRAARRRAGRAGLPRPLRRLRRHRARGGEPGRRAGAPGRVRRPHRRPRPAERGRARPRRRRPHDAGRDAGPRRRRPGVRRRLRRPAVRARDRAPRRRGRRPGRARLAGARRPAGARAVEPLAGADAGRRGVADDLGPLVRRDRPALRRCWGRARTPTASVEP